MNPIIGREENTTIMVSYAKCGGTHVMDRGNEMHHLCHAEAASLSRSTVHAPSDNGGRSCSVLGADDGLD
jgi:hypothetical protein